MNILAPQGSPFQEETPEMVTKRLAEEKAWHEEMYRLIENGYITTKNEPLKCTACESVGLEDVVTDSIDHIILGYDRKCKSCGVRLGSWDTGSWCY